MSATDRFEKMFYYTMVNYNIPILLLSFNSPVTPWRNHNLKDHNCTDKMLYYFYKDNYFPHERFKNKMRNLTMQNFYWLDYSGGHAQVYDKLWLSQPNFWS